MILDKPLPQSWTSKRLKYLATYNDEALPETTEGEAEIDYVEISGVSLAGGIEEVNRMSFYQAPSRARRKVQAGDILVSTVRTYLKAIATVGVDASEDLIASTGFCVVRPGKEMDSAYLGWVAKSEPFVGEVVARSVGVSYPAINASDLVDMSVPVPPMPVQQRIARFLDEKTARIDALIEKKQALLERLAEKRQALITRTVTKGLNPDAQMKPSGVDWLGEMPRHWEVKRLRFLCDGGTLNGLYKTKEQFSPDGVPFVQMGEAFRSETFEGETKDRVLASEAEVEKWGLKLGDFLFARRSLVFEGSGKSVMIGAVDEDHVFESSMIRIRLLSPRALAGFVSHYFRSSVCRAFVLSITKQVTISGIDSQQLKEVLVPVPPDDEAQRISEACEKVWSDIESIEKFVASSIATLTEHRSALITAGVTGQLPELNG